MNPRVVKTEAAEAGAPLRSPPTPGGGGSGASVSAVASSVIDLISSDSDSDGEGSAIGSGKRQLSAGGGSSTGKRARVSAAEEDVPPGFLDPIPPPPPARCATKQFWKAGDYDGKPLGDGALLPSGPCFYELFSWFISVFDNAE